MIKVIKTIIKTSLLVGMMGLFGCAVVTPERLSIDELANQSKTDLAAMFNGQTVLDKPLSIEDAIERVLSQNLDARAQVMEEALALGQAELDRWDFLPKLTANAENSRRSELNATNSQTIGSSTPPGDYSYSADRTSRAADLSMTWNILDFGVSYYNAQQNADRSLIAHERRRN